MDAMPPARRREDGALVREIPGTGLDVKVDERFAEGHPLLPAFDPGYHFRKDLCAYTLYGAVARKNVLLTGGAGTGKTSLVTQLAALTGTPLRRVNLHGESDTTLFVGRDLPTEVDGTRTLVFRPGILATAMVEGHWLLLDEIDAALQPVLFVLQQVLEDGGKLLLEDVDHTVVEKHPNFRVFATANTVGRASRNRLLYSGTTARMNSATLDRFGVVVHVDYLDAEREQEVVQERAPRTDPDFVRAVVEIAHSMRTQLENEGLASTFSTRQCVEWAQACQFFHPKEAARFTVLDRLSPEDAEVVQEVIGAYFG